MTDFVIVGLGNPGDEYARTRHNAGFLAVDRIAEAARAHYWKSECGSLTAKVEWRGSQLVLAKPQSFMNVVGGPVKQLLKTYGVQPDHLIVIHDDLELPAGEVRVKNGGGHGGHNGLRSIGDKLCTRDWLRVRCGIGRPPGRMKVADYVLSEPRRDAADAFEQAVDAGAQAALSLVEVGFDRTQRRFG